MEYNRRTAKIAKYYNIAKEGNGPISLQVSLTDSCFNRCIMCGHPYRPQQKMDINRWLEFLEGVPFIPESICYSGGDPMAYSDFNDVMTYHINNNIAFGATITGYVPPTIDMSLLAKAQWIRVSLDSIDPIIYEKVRGKIKLEKVLNSIDKMLEAKVNVCLGITVHKENESDLGNVLSWAESKGIYDVETHHIRPDTNSDMKKVNKDGVGEAEGWERDIKPFKKCHAALYQLYIEASGAVYPCCITAGDSVVEEKGYALGNIFEDKWTNIWWNVKRYASLDISMLPEVCRTCCIQRLSEINHVCDRIESEKWNKVFF